MYICNYIYIYIYIQVCILRSYFLFLLVHSTRGTSAHTSNSIGNHAQLICYHSHTHWYVHIPYGLGCDMCVGVWVLGLERCLCMPLWRKTWYTCKSAMHDTQSMQTALNMEQYAINNEGNCMPFIGQNFCLQNLNIIRTLTWSAQFENLQMYMHCCWMDLQVQAWSL